MARFEAQSIEKIADRAAAALLGLAVAYAAYRLLPPVAQPQRIALCSLGFMLAYLLSGYLLHRVEGDHQRFPLPDFAPADDLPQELPELLLTDEYRTEKPSGEEPLLLDDVLGELKSDSRVVQLFDAARMPTPGQLDARIRRHLESGRSTAAPDASQALHEALAELRSSLR